MYSSSVFARVIRALSFGLAIATADAAVAQSQEQTAPSQEHEHEATVPGLFPSRDSSGTAWLPDMSPMYGFHQQRGAWEVMLHGNLFAQYLNEGGEFHRRGQQAGMINWFMGMARRPMAGGRAGIRGMVSLEPLTIPGCGYPVLLATGETCDGDSIHDRQHPHDLFMELAAEYERPLTSSVRWQLYGGPAGEPALGPPAFPHRLSAMPNLLAPMAHHWLDATHITYGLVTSGVYGNRWKTEVSLFNGREPDERRTDLDLAALDSYAGRVWLLPTERLAFQVSSGRLTEAEAAHGTGPRHDVVRTTASATYHASMGAAGFWATTMAWGANAEEGDTTHAFVLETAATSDGRNTWFGRAEVAEKSAEALHVHESTGVFTVGRIQGGYVRYLSARGGLQPGIGLTASASIVPAALEARYGGRVVPGMGIFLTLRPAAHAMGSATAATTDPHAGHVMPPASAAPPPAAPASRPVAPSPPAASPATPPGDPRLPVVAAERVIDPACATTIDLVNAPRASYQGRVYYFCSTADQAEFLKDPDAYLKRRAR